MRGATLRAAYGHSVVFLISIHAPHAGRDSGRRARPPGDLYFNPRAPCGARRCSASSADMTESFQSTRPMRGATLAVCRWALSRLNFNPCAPYGARLIAVLQQLLYVQFQSTRPVWGATPAFPQLQSAEGYFNPRAPYGARLAAVVSSAYAALFQSTRPVWGATVPKSIVLQPVDISIHAPRMGRDRRCW